MDELSSNVAPGTVLDDRYRIDALIGTGGMSRVYLAHDLTLGRRVAVKIVTAVGDELDADERVRVETATLAALTHPNLVTLHDARLSEPGPRYLVMEYVDGPSLSSRVAQGPLSPDEVTRLAAELAEALTVVHAGDVVHRDIKPSNILLAPGATASRPRRAKLADFGIAHLLGSERLTQPGMLIGTAAYLAPEVALGHAPAPASDIYALGLVLLEALTGARAFPSAEGPAQVFARLAQDPVIPAGLSPLWTDLLTAMLSRDPAARPTAAAVADTLVVPHRPADEKATAVMAPMPPTESAAAAAARFAATPAPTTPRWRRRPVLVAAALAIAIAIALVGGSLALWAGLADTPAVEPAPSPSAPSAPSASVTSVVEPAAPTDPAPEPAPKAPADQKDKNKDKGGPGNGNGNGNG